MVEVETRPNWFVRNRLTLFTVLVIALYAGFVEWAWGWASILSGWREVGLWTVVLALMLLVGTYVIRAHRMHDYFPRETAGRFLWLFRLTQIHNLLNIMLPFRTGETSFPLLMRAEFGVPLAHGTSALLVLRLLDLHALLAVGGFGVLAGTGYEAWASVAWVLFLLAPLLVFPLKDRAIGLAKQKAPLRLARLMDQVADGIPRDLPTFLRAWLLTFLNWGVKVAVMAWVLGLMGVEPLAACFGGAIGGELSSVLPVHAPGGVGTYPAGIAAGAAALGASKSAGALAILARASINTHLMMIVSSLVATGISLVLPWLAGVRGRRTGRAG
jgi:uncharacterized membrane protein YbhN (UPF0104 family)